MAPPPCTPPALCTPTPPFEPPPAPLKYPAPIFSMGLVARSRLVFFLLLLSPSMEDVLTGLKQRMPELFETDANGITGLRNYCRITIPIKPNTTTTIPATVGQTGIQTGYCKDGHQLCAVGDKLRWAGITVENKESKYNFVADLTFSSGALTVTKFQLNCFLGGVMTSPPLPLHDATIYLAEYMDEENDWHNGYTVGSTEEHDPYHPDTELLIANELGTEPTRTVQIVRIPAPPEPEPPKLLEWLGEQQPQYKHLKVRKGETIHGIIFVNTDRTRAMNDGIAYPMFLFHGIKIANAKKVAGSATRCLIATFAGDHEPGGVDIVDSVTELRTGNDKAVFIKFPEEVVLHFFHELTEDESDVYGQPMSSPPGISLPSILK